MKTPSRKGLFLGFLVIVLLLIWCGSASAEDQDVYSVERWVPPKPVSTEMMPWHSREIIEVKLLEGTPLYTLQSGNLSAPPGNLEPSHFEFLLKQSSVTQVKRLFQNSNSLQYGKSMAALENASGEQMPDLSLWFRIRVPASIDVRDLIEQLNALPEVEIAYPAPLPAPPPATPDFSMEQEYLSPSPHGGIDAEYAWGFSGGSGSNVTIVDIEYDFYPQHEDLPVVSLVGGQRWNGYGDDHGTAVLGQLFGTNNALGVIGVAHGAAAKFVSPCLSSSNCDYNVANAVDAARLNTQPGDVILLEQQTPVCGSGKYGPVEWIPSVFDAIKIATTAGRHVVQAAGNGGADLDDASCLGRFDRLNRDSGAIIVGAGSSPNYQTDGSRLSFSTYGSRVDLQGWGVMVTTTGYGDLYQGIGKGQWYTSGFSGTSSASAIVAGAVALVSSIGKDSAKIYMPAELRVLLIQTGTPQQDWPGVPVSQNIGPRPNLAAALAFAAKPAAPSALAATVESTSRIDLSWRDRGNNETGFRIERRIGKGPWSQIATVGVNVTTYASTGLKRSTTYGYRVRAYNGVGTSAYSNSVTTRTAAPAPPSPLTATAASNSRIDLSWRDRGNNETGFRIERRIGKGPWSQIATVGANVTTFTSTGLKRSTTYGYRVRAYNGIGTSAYSNPASTKTR